MLDLLAQLALTDHLDLQYVSDFRSKYCAITSHLYLVIRVLLETRGWRVRKEIRVTQDLRESVGSQERSGEQDHRVHRERLEMMDLL